MILEKTQHIITYYAIQELLAEGKGYSLSSLCQLGQISRLAYYKWLNHEDSPASVHTMNVDNLKPLRIISSSGLSVFCSFVLPLWILKARGVPSSPINNPISIIGLGLCSSLKLYCFKPFACSVLKK
jgi:hypothetical protein